MNRKLKQTIIDLENRLRGIETSITLMSKDNTRNTDELVRKADSAIKTSIETHNAINKAMLVNKQWVNNIETYTNDVNMSFVKIDKKVHEVGLAIKSNEEALQSMTRSVNGIVDEFGCYDDDYEEELIDDMDATYKAEIEAEIENDDKAFDAKIANSVSNMIPMDGSNA